MAELEKRHGSRQVGTYYCRYSVRASDQQDQRVAILYSVPGAGPRPHARIGGTIAASQVRSH